MTRGSIALGINIDHVATIRQARRGRFPDPVHAARKERQPAMFASEDFENAARISVRPMVQDVGRGELDSRDARGHSSPRCLSARALSAQFSRTFTHRVR